jgi:hypothetical protein
MWKCNSSVNQYEYMVLTQIVKQLFKTFFANLYKTANYVSAHLPTQGIFFFRKPIYFYFNLFSFSISFYLFTWWYWDLNPRLCACC